MGTYLALGLMLTCILLLVRQAKTPVDTGLVLLAILLWPVLLARLGWQMFKNFDLPD
jgi:hypothetical protein